MHLRWSVTPPDLLRSLCPVQRSRPIFRSKGEQSYPIRCRTALGFTSKMQLRRHRAQARHRQHPSHRGAYTCSREEDFAAPPHTLRRIRVEHGMAASDLKAFSGRPKSGRWGGPAAGRPAGLTSHVKHTRSPRILFSDLPARHKPPASSSRPAQPPASHLPLPHGTLLGRAPHLIRVRIQVPPRSLRRLAARPLPPRIKASLVSLRDGPAAPQRAPLRRSVARLQAHGAVRIMPSCDGVSVCGVGGSKGRPCGAGFR